MKETSGKKLVYTLDYTNTHDHILLVDGAEHVLSIWPVMRKELIELLAEGTNPDGWDVHAAEGIYNPSVDRLVTIEDYGEVVAKVDQNGWEIIDPPLWHKRLMSWLGDGVCGCPSECPGSARPCGPGVK